MIKAFLSDSKAIAVVCGLIILTMNGFLLPSCAPTGLATEDVNSLHDIELATARAYSYADAGAGRAFDRAAYCAAEAILRRNGNDAGSYQTDSIDCMPKGRQ